MWTTPSVVSIFARWLPSSTSSTISGWISRIRPTSMTCSRDAPARSTQTSRSGAPHRSGSAVNAASSVHSLPAPSTMAVIAETARADAVGRGNAAGEPVAEHVRTVGLVAALPHVLVAGAARRSSSVAGVGRSDAIGSRLRVGRGPPGSPVRIRARTTALRRSPAAARRDGRPGRATAARPATITPAATTNSPTMIDAASRDAQLSSASTTSGSLSGRSRSASGMNAW